MRDKMIMLLVVSLCACLGGCASDSSSKEVRENQGFSYENPIVLTRLRENMTIDEERERTLEVIDSWEEWSDLSKKIMEEDSAYVDYDKEFFKDKDLLLIKFVAKCDNLYTLDKMELEERQLNKKLTISMTEKEKSAPGYYQNSLLTMHKTGMLAEVDKGSVPEDVIWHLSMGEGAYDWKCGFIAGMGQSDGEWALELDEGEWVKDEAQMELQFVSKGEPAKAYAMGARVRYVASTAGIESYNQSHKQKLEAMALTEEESVLDEESFMKYMDYLSQTDDGQHISFGVSIDDGEIVAVEEMGIL